MGIRKNRWRVLSQKRTIFGLSLLFGLGVVIAQPPMLRRHTANQKRELVLVEATENPPGKSNVAVSLEDNQRVIRVNSIPDHLVGQFPNRGNPHRIEQRELIFRMPVEPRPLEKPLDIRLGLNFGVGLNGILFDPGAAEFWLGDRFGGWQYEALGGAVPLGLDTHYAHVQPDGKYHYHGVPKGLLESVGFESDKHSPLIGWAADGYPIYAINGFKVGMDAISGTKELQPSFRLRSGQRPSGVNGPGGNYDGTFVEDYEYVQGLGDLDECNGRQCVTPEFPNGTYAYFLTHHWPVVPRKFHAQPDPSFEIRPSGPPSGRPGNRRGSR